MGIAGCGKVAHLHARAIADLESIELVGVWSRTWANAVEFADSYEVKACERIAEMVRNESIDIVIVCTPHPFHADSVEEAARAGAHVLVEKPLASTLADCDRMIEVCRAKGVKLGVVSQRRWYEASIRVKAAIDAGKIGKPILGTVVMLGWRDQSYYDMDEWRGTWAMEGGGVMVNQAPHPLDLFLWYMGDVEEVYGIRRNLNHPGIEVEDTAVAVVKFKSGAIGNIVLSNSQKPGLYAKVHVHGENGASVGTQPEGGSMFIAGSTSVMEPAINDLWTVPGEEDFREQWIREDTASFGAVDPTVHYIGLQIQDMAESIDEEREPAVTGYEGRKVVELFTAIYRSTRDNGPIRFPLSAEEDREDMDGRLG
ncbi:Homoserine dehydrogenase, NAD binding domain family [Verrucomicrobiia bacterium DG1235]|nr:Homoserine dehydrogenase, NAD binding domain family [Verrucomicrobiae bacterium DG1235]